MPPWRAHALARFARPSAALVAEGAALVAAATMAALVVPLTIKGLVDAVAAGDGDVTAAAATHKTIV